jgi:hypothetical protein
MSRRNWSHDKFIKELHKIKKDEYEVVGKFRGLTYPVEVTHTVCNSTYLVKADKLLTNAGCNTCKLRRETKTPEWFTAVVFKLVGNEYTVLTDYMTAKKKVTMRHNTCHYEWRVSPDNFIRRSSRCPNCAGNKRTTTNEFKRDMEVYLGGEYEVQGSYKNARTKMVFTHKECGNSWKIVPYSIKAGVRFPHCRKSKGEKRVQEILESMGIKYHNEQRFVDCRHKNPLPFDFYLPDYNICIEYDGIHHFEPTFFGGTSERGVTAAKKSFQETQVKDRIKEAYCNNSGTTLIRIPYFLEHDEVESILRRYLV